MMLPLLARRRAALSRGSGLPQRLQQNLPRVAAYSSFALVGVLHIYAGAADYGPVWTDDEIGVLANARVIAGVGEPYTLNHLSYYPGWSIVLAPLWWVFSDAQDVYRAAVALSALAGIALVAPLTALARRVGLSRYVAVIAACVIAVAPARTVMSSYALTENFLTLVVAMTAVAAVRYASRPTVASAGVLGLGAAAAFVVHGRLVTLLAMTVLWFGIDLVRRRGRRAALVGLATAVGLASAGFMLHTWVTVQLYGSAGSRESTALDVFTSLVPEAVLRSGTGQAWSLTTAWLSLPFIGMVIVTTLMRREVLRRRPGLGWWALGVLVGASALSIASVSAAIARGSGRVDIVAYGRYLDPVIVPLALVGLALLLKRAASVRALLVVSGITLVVSLAFMGWIVPSVERGGWWAPINIAGLLGRSWPLQYDLAAPPWLSFTLTAVAAVAAYLVLRRRPWLLVVGLMFYFTVSSVAAQTRLLKDWNSEQGSAPQLVRVIEQLDPAEVSYDALGADWPSQNAFQFWLTGRDVIVFSSDVEAPPTDLVISRRSWPYGEAVGAGRVSGSYGDEVLWVLPGSLYDSFEQRGLIELDPPTDEFEDYGHQLVRVGEVADTPLTISQDGTAELRIRVTNEGSRVWPAFGTTESDTGTVRVQLAWPTELGQALTMVDLPGSVLPGESLTIDTTVQVPQEVLDGGRLELTVVHEGVRAFTDGGEPSLTIPIDVLG